MIRAGFSVAATFAYAVAWFLIATHHYPAGIGEATIACVLWQVAWLPILNRKEAL